MMDREELKRGLLSAMREAFRESDPSSMHRHNSQIRNYLTKICMGNKK